MLPMVRIVERGKETVASVSRASAGLTVPGILKTLKMESFDEERFVARAIGAICCGAAPVVAVDGSIGRAGSYAEAVEQELGNVSAAMARSQERRPQEMLRRCMTDTAGCRHCLHRWRLGLRTEVMGG